MIFIATLKNLTDFFSETYQLEYGSLVVLFFIAMAEIIMLRLIRYLSSLYDVEAQMQKIIICSFWSDFCLSPSEKPHSI